MRRLALSIAMGACLLSAGLAPVAIAGNQPAATMTTPDGCASVVYSWANMRKATRAHIEVRPDGVLFTTVDSGPAGANESFTLPPEITFVSGQHYTLLGFLTDSAGRRIATSGAAWWGYC